MHPITVAIIGLAVAALGVYIGWVGFPAMLHSGITKAKSLEKRTETRKNWATSPLALDFDVYIFNVTNPDEVHVGKKAKVQEIGPYCYKEWKSKVNFEDDPEEDTVKSNMVNKYIFDAEGTKPLTGDEVLVIPHMLILTFATITMQTKPGALSVINKAIPHIFGNPKNIFLTTTAKEFLFEGILLNCTKSKEFAANAVCDQIRTNPKGLQVVDQDYFRFSIFGLANNTPSANEYVVKRGMKDVLDVGKVVFFNGKPELDVWSGPECNEIKGTDGTVFAPFMEPGVDVDIFGGDLCRSLSLKYQKPSVYKKIKTFYYTSDFGDMSTDPHLKCFCPTNDTCLKKGAFDLTKCTGAPIILTLPHFTECDIKYLNGVEGMNPSKENHMIEFFFEPITGSPVVVYNRVQFNMFVQSIKKITIMKELSPEPFLMPIFWINEGVAINDTLARTVINKLYRPIQIVKYGRYVIIATGLSLVGLAAFLFYRKTTLNPDGSVSGDNKTTISQVGPAY